MKEGLFGRRAIECPLSWVRHIDLYGAHMDAGAVIIVDTRNTPKAPLQTGSQTFLERINLFYIRLNRLVHNRKKEQKGEGRGR